MKRVLALMLAAMLFPACAHSRCAGAAGPSEGHEAAYAVGIALGLVVVGVAVASGTKLPSCGCGVAAPQAQGLHVSF